MLRGLGEDGREMSTERLVRVAGLAASFLETTDFEVRKYLAKETELAPVIAFAQSLLVGASGAQPQRGSAADVSAAAASLAATVVTVEMMDVRPSVATILSAAIADLIISFCILAFSRA
jgi:hypothetical protein